MVLLLSLLGARAAALACPPGTGTAEKTEAGAMWRGCVRADGTWHGPVVLTEPDGSVWTGSMFDGLQHGPWIHTSGSGSKLEAGQFSAGQRMGDWLTWDHSGELRGRVDFAVGSIEPAPVQDTRGRAFVETTIEVDALTVVATDRQLGAYEGTELVWSHPLASPPAAMALADGWALVAESDGHLTALDLEEGQVARIAVGAKLGTLAGMVDPSNAHPEVAVVLDSRGQASAIDLWTGERLWRGESFFNPIRGAAEGHSVYLTRSKKLVRLRAADGNEEWAVKTPHLPADLVLAGEDVYVLDHAGAVTAYDTRKGERRWTRENVLAATDVVAEALRWTEGELVVRGRERVVILDDEGEELDRFSMPAGARGRADAWRGRMVVENGDGDLVLTSADGAPHTIEANGAMGFEVLEHDLVVVDADGIATIDPADVELEGVAPPDTDPLWDVRDDARTSVAGLPHALPMTVRVEPDGARVLYVDATQVGPGDVVRIELGWTEDDGAGAFELADGWTVTELPGEMTLALVQSWAPRVVQAWFRDAGGERREDTDAFFDRLLHCEEPAIRYDGTMLLDDGLRDFRLEGIVEVRPERHAFPWGEACLLHVSTLHDRFGVWSPPDGPSWVGLMLRGQSVAPTEDGALVGDASAHLAIDYLVPRQDGAVTFETVGPFELSIEEGVLSVTGTHGSIRLDVGEVHSLAEGGELHTWQRHHRWSVASRIDGPGWIPVGTVGTTVP
jgi:hypothetical protein